MVHTASLQAVVLGLAAVVSVVLTANLLQYTQSHPYHTYDVRSLVNSYQGFPGDNYPRMIDTPTPFVKMVFEETVHYDPSDLDMGTLDWNYAYPPGSGTYRYGPDERTLIASVFHQLHCIQMFSKALVISTNSTQWAHTQHCLNYMRELALCRPDLTLEPGDFSQKNFTEDRVGAVHICRDIEVTYGVLRKNWADWSLFVEAHGDSNTTMAVGS